jgi:hypothetical protein
LCTLTGATAAAQPAPPARPIEIEATWQFDESSKAIEAHWSLHAHYRVAGNCQGGGPAIPKAVRDGQNFFLDHRDDTQQGFGYAVFGKVIKGLDVVRKIEAVRTQTKPSGDGVPLSDVPAEAVVIKTIRLSK